MFARKLPSLTTAWACSLLWVGLCGGVAHADEPLVVVLTIKAHRFEPAAVTVPADKPFTLIVRNTDDTAEEFESPDLHLEKIATAGKELQFKLPGRRAGRYRFFGDFHQDSAQGVLTVQ